MEQGGGRQVDGTNAKLQLALFRLDVSHERIQDPVTREVLATGKSARQGINVDAEVRLTPALTLLADGTINDAHVKGEPKTRASLRCWHQPRGRW